MKMKRSLSLLIVLMLMLSVLSGCASDTSVLDESQQPVVESQEVVEETEEEALDAEAVILAHTTEYLNNMPDDLNMIGAQEALDMIEGNPDALFVVDLRSKEDYDKGHLPGAVNIPFGTVGENLDRLPMNRQMIVYCYSGQTSGETVAALNLLGFKALSFKGGMNFGWSKLDLAEDTLETDENILPEPKEMDLSEEEQILWDAVVGFYSDGKNYIEGAESVHELISNNPGATHVLDIRSKEDFDKGHIEGADNIPFGEVGNNFDKIPSNKPVYITCYSGQTAAQTLMMLRLNGYNVTSISKGMGGWNEAELPVITN